MHLQLIDWLIILGYFVTVVGVGFLLRRRIRANEDFFLFIMLCMATIGIGRSAESGSFKRFAGAWELVSYELRLASGTVLKPFGEHPVGRILYQENGQMSAQLMRPAAAPFASADPFQARPDETDGAWRDYVGYWGTFRVDLKARVVVHEIEGCWFPNWIGQKQVRAFRFSGGRLTLEADSPAWHATLIWKKIDSAG